MPLSAAFIDLIKTEPNNCAKLCAQFRDFQIVRSLLAFKLLGIPTLDALIVIQINGSIEAKLSKLIKDRGWDQVMLRRDLPTYSAGKILGGYIFPASLIMKEIKTSIESGYIVILHPPYSRYDNIYSGNILFNRNENKVIIEVVTSGFDLSDLNRGFSIPHERFTIWGPTEVDSWDNLSVLDILEHEHIDIYQYRESWKNRLQKVTREIIKSTTSQNSEEIQIKAILKARGETLLIDVQDKPNPLGYEELCNIYMNSAYFFTYSARFGFTETELSLGFGRPAKAHLIFWSVFAR